MKSTPSLFGIILAIAIAILGTAYMYDYISRNIEDTNTVPDSRDTDGVEDALFRERVSDTNPELYDITYEPTYSDEQLWKFQARLDELLESEEWGGTRIESRENLIARQIEKARLHEALGQTGEAIRVLEIHYEDNIDNNSELLGLMATLYEKVEAYDLALARLDILVREIGDFTYLQRVAEIWWKKGDEQKAQKAMRAYRTLLRQAEENAGARVVPDEE